MTEYKQHQSKDEDYSNMDLKSAEASESALSDFVMRFLSPGTYEIKTHTGKVYSIKIIERGGRLGYWSEITKTFIPVSKFVEVEVLRMYSNDEARRLHC